MKKKKKQKQTKWRSEQLLKRPRDVIFTSGGRINLLSHKNVKAPRVCKKPFWLIFTLEKEKEERRAEGGKGRGRENVAGIYIYIYMYTSRGIYIYIYAILLMTHSY